MKILFSTMLISFIVMIIWLFLFKKYWIVDTPRKYKDLKRKIPVPRLMWVFMILATILSIVILIPGYWSFKEIQFLFIWAIFLWIIAVIDDIKWLSPQFRLLTQIFVSIIWISWWAIITHINIMGNVITVPYYIWFILSLIWFILIINSFNWFDWINWMWSWVASIWFLSIALLIKLVIFKYYNINQNEYNHLIFLLNLSLIMTWVSIIFTIMEIKPFWLIRDVWIMFLWYVLAYLSLFTWAKIWILLIVLSLVIFDSFWVIINRIKNWQNPMKWDYTHLHHRLMKHWRTRSEIRMFVRIWSIFFMILTILQWTNSANKLIILLMIFIIFFWIHIYMYWIKKLPVWLWDRQF